MYDTVRPGAVSNVLGIEPELVVFSTILHSGSKCTAQIVYGCYSVPRAVLAQYCWLRGCQPHNVHTRTITSGMKALLLLLLLTVSQWLTIVKWRAESEW